MTDDTVRTAVLVLAGLLAVPLLMMVVMMPMMGLAGWGHMSAWGGGWGATVAMAIPLLVLGALGYLLYLGVREDSGGETNDALAELRAAYARGELSDEEFERRRDRLGSQ